MNRWNIQKAKQSIEWIVKENDSHADDIEMAGFSVSHVIKYGADIGNFFISIIPFFPRFAVVPTIHTHRTN